ncbi:MAG: hypothetical protein ACXU8Z_08255 [Caulobacteraceae bacterium]
MIHHIAVYTPGNRRRAVYMFDQIDLPKIRLPSARQVERFYCDEGLEAVRAGLRPT